MSRAEKIAGIAWRVARWAMWTRRLRKNGPVPTTRASGRSRTNVAKAALISRLVPALKTWNLQSHGAGSGFHVSAAVAASALAGIDKHGHASGGGHQLAQKFQPLRRQLTREEY